MKAVTEFGIKEVKPKKRFNYLGEDWVICDFPVKYMNAEEPLMMLRCIHYNSGRSIPVMPERGTLKAFIEKVKNGLDIFLNMYGEDKFKEELVKQEKINE